MPSDDTSSGQSNAFEKLYIDLFRSRPGTTAGVSRNQAGAALLKNHGRLLDIGCGCGDLYSIVKDRYDEVHGIDIIPEVVDICIKKGIKARRVDLNVENLPYEENTFDSVACFDLIEHILSPMTLLNEVRRVLKPGGEIVILTPNIRRIWTILRLIFKGKSPKTSDEVLEPYDNGHIHYFTSRDIVEMLSAQGFQNTSVSGWGKVLSRLNWLPTKFLVGPVIDREFLHGGIAVRAEKKKE